jgi:hypothetical protein
MADNIRATPRNEFLGLLADAMYGGLEYMKDPRRTQQMQGLAGLLESTGIPKTTERMAYGEDLTNIGRANVPLLKPETAEAMMTVAPMAKTAGNAAKGVARMYGSEINAAMMGERGGLLGAVTPQPKFMVTPEEVSKFKSSTQSLTGNNVFDPRFDDRILEQERLKNLRTTVIPVNDYVAPKVSLGQYEGYPFITSMSDRTGTGLLTDINDVVLNYPVERQGGQNFMFENPFVWASGKDPAADILELAQEFRRTTGKNPLYIPQRMTPSGGDFANMTGETMLSYAQAAMGQSGKKQLDRFVKNNYIADWKGLDDPSSIDQFRSLSDKKRKSMKKQMDKYFRNEGGLSIGEARLAMADKNQLTSKDAGIMNIGEIYANQPIIPVSGHRAYPSAVPGRGLGVADKDLNIFQLLEQHSKNRGLLDPTNPTREDRRTLEMKPYGGVLTGDLLKKLGY